MMPNPVPETAALVGKHVQHRFQVTEAEGGTSDLRIRWFQGYYM